MFDRFLTVIALAIVGTALVGAQPPFADEPDSRSVQRIRTELRKSEPTVVVHEPLFGPPAPREFRLGVLTFVPPDARGQFVAVRIPVGALAAHAFQSIAAGQRRRATNAARDDASKRLAAFLSTPPN
jgi:hypothetical protein